MTVMTRETKLRRMIAALHDLAKEFALEDRPRHARQLTDMAELPAETLVRLHDVLTGKE